MTLVLFAPPKAPRFILFGFFYFPFLIAIPYYLSIYNLSFIDCYFEAVSGFTSTGFTIFNNIKYAKPDASDEEIFTAAKISMCTDFIEKLENKFQTVIGENGVKLSGGEKQRLSIARALLKDSKIILLDEATSSLDSETEEKIQKAIEELTKNKTTVVIAHRLSTILNSEKIYVVDKGSVESSGKHDDLIKNSLLYKNFYERQIKNN